MIDEFIKIRKELYRLNNSDIQTDDKVDFICNKFLMEEFPYIDNFESKDNDTYIITLFVDNCNIEHDYITVDSSFFNNMLKLLKDIIYSFESLKYKFKICENILYFSVRSADKLAPLTESFKKQLIDLCTKYRV